MYGCHSQLQLKKIVALVTFYYTIISRQCRKTRRRRRWLRGHQAYDTRLHSPVWRISKVLFVKIVLSTEGADKISLLFQNVGGYCLHFNTQLEQNANRRERNKKKRAEWFQWPHKILTLITISHGKTKKIVRVCSRVVFTLCSLHRFCVFFFSFLFLFNFYHLPFVVVQWICTS